MNNTVSAKLLVALSVFAAIMAGAALADSFYQWADEQGNVHFADSPAGIPPQYRKNVKTGEFKEKKAGKTDEPGSKSGQAAEQPQAEPAIPAAKPKPKRYEVPYEAFEGSARRIIINVRFNESVTAPMILDTGAPGLVISPRLAEKLGIFDNDEGKLFALTGGIGGSAPAIITIMDTVRIGDAVDHFVPTTITQSISGNFEGLLGMDFMANFSFTIDTAGQKLILEELPETTGRPGGHDETWWRLTFKDFARTRKGWEGFLNYLKKQEVESTFTGTTMATIKRWKSFAEKQYSEADKLFSKLDNYAARHSVPMAWRRY
ncbi:MAG: aspartyl protease family protein [Nitrospinae bacterium]|nr:aspartyl protease family protein [Nitrospinota bacterium]